MITVPGLAAEALGSFLTMHMGRRFGATHADLIALIPSAARLALECIGNSDALYHDVEHTMLVTLVGLSELEIANFSTHGEFLTPLNSLGFLLPRQFTKITKRVRSREPQV